MSNYISATISAENQAKALANLAELHAIFSFGIKLTKEQRQGLSSVDDGRLPFVEKAIQFGKQEPKIVPLYIDLNEYTNDLGLFKDLSSIAREISSIYEIIADTRMAAGTDAFEAARNIYRTAQGAAKNGVPGTQSMVDEMKKLFEGQGATKKVS